MKNRDQIHKYKGSLKRWTDSSLKPQFSNWRVIMGVDNKCKISAQYIQNYAS